MKAVVQTGYGSADVIELGEIERPTPGNDEVLVRVMAASLAAGDYFGMRGRPFPARLSIGFPTPKKDYVVGLDFAGIVESTGTGVTRFQAGDEVYGECRGSCAEYAVAKASRIARKPHNLTFEQAAAVPTSACTALQGLRDHGKVRPGQQVLVNGASGGVGPFAVQIAKALGAEVTAVCSTRNVEMARSVGADHVIDYTQEDFTQGGSRYDVIMDNVGSHSLSGTRRALTPQGIHIPSSGHAGMGWIIRAAIVAVFVRRQGAPFVAFSTAEDLGVLAQLIDSGKVAPVIDRTYALRDAREAFAYLNEGHARGKVVISVGTAAAIAPRVVHPAGEEIPLDEPGIRKLSLAVESLLRQESFESTLGRLRLELAGSADTFVWSTLDLSSLPLELPEAIKSGWIFHLRSDVPSGCHYHPNSVQHVAVVSGHGQSNIGGQRRDIVPFGSSSSPVGDWLIIDRGVSHEFIPAGGDMTVVSFHTCTSDELKEVECDTGSTRLYEAADA